METNKDISKLISFLKDNAEDGFTKEDFITAKASIRKEKLSKDKKTNEYINKPIDIWNHFLDALRYSLQCCEKHKLQTISKAKLGL